MYFSYGNRTNLNFFYYSQSHVGVFLPYVQLNTKLLYISTSFLVRLCAKVSTKLDS